MLMIHRNNGIVWLACVMLAIISWHYYADALPTTDVAWRLYVAQQILAGKQLYRDIIEVNLPAIYYLCVPVVALAKLLNAPLGLMVHMLHYGMAALSLLLCQYVIVRSRCYTERHIQQTLLVMIAFVELIVFSSFGQKEHLFMMLALPYILAVALDSVISSRKMAVTIGICAGLGAIIKPFFVAFLVVTELVRMASERNFFAWIRQETLVAGVIGLVYIVLVVTLFPEYGSNIVPLIEHLYKYYAFKTGYEIFAVIAMQFLAMSGVLLPLMLGYVWVRPDRYVVLVSACMAVSLAMVFVQGKGWDYHIYPAVAFVFILYAPVLARTLAHLVVVVKDRTGTVKIQGKQALEIALLFSTVSAAFFVVSIMQYRQQEYQSRAAINAQITKTIQTAAPKATRVMIIGRIDDAWPLMLGAPWEWSSRFSSLWGLDAGANIRKRFMDQGLIAASEDYFMRSVAEDLIVQKPDIVVVNVGGEVNYLGVINENQWVGAAFRHYRWAGQEQEGYRYFVRETSVVD